MKQYILVVAITLAIIAGCSEAETEPLTSPEAWTVAEGDIQLEEDLFIAETDDFFFGSIRELDVASDGRMFVLDTRENHVKVISSEGELLQTVGSEGEAPGEFRGPQALALGRGDSLFVWHVRNRISAFDTESYEFAYSVGVDTPERYQLRSRWMTRSLGFFVPEDEGFIAAFRPHFADDGPALVQRIAPDGALADTALVTTTAGEFLVHEPHPGAVAGWTTKPFGRNPAFALGPDDRVYHGWSDSLGVSIHDPSTGALHDRWIIAYEPVPVTDAMADEAMPEADHYQEMIREQGLADTKPAFDYLLVDDRHRVWFKRATADPDRAEWWVANPDQVNVATVSLPAGVDLRVVQNGYAYGQTTADDGAPALVRYRIVEETPI